MRPATPGRCNPKWPPTTRGWNKVRLEDNLQPALCSWLAARLKNLSPGERSLAIDRIGYYFCGPNLRNPEAGCSLARAARRLRSKTICRQGCRSQPPPAFPE